MLQDGQTPLGLALSLNHGDLVAPILGKLADGSANCVDINFPVNKEGATPLHAAARFNHVKLVEALISRGAKVEAVDKVCMR